eukprot:CAMPEP_0169088034 /NCGR_PEP_ID=MMETSP1015-20121227/14542_1 /TAXON_ID=342587 /ORGANISM="Karlodinium micrum, Strain CCMP2283" /LENGTH=566 /DNA_ID=CAMNT_0009148289 /DNA_START=114 /DNA_END=1815 /DNA_ORIENTATION=-
MVTEEVRSPKASTKTGAKAPVTEEVRAASGAKVTLTEEDQMNVMKTILAYRESVDKLRSEGTIPEMSLFDVLLATKNEMGVQIPENIDKMIVEAEESGGLAVLDYLAGPWKAARTKEEKVNCYRDSQMLFQTGSDVTTWAKYQLQYGDQGLSTNIAVPLILAKGVGTERSFYAGARVIISNPSDAERLSRTHIRKEENFQGILFDSVISTSDNEHWINQRRHLAEAFLPLSSLAEILPISLSRAKHCADRLASLSTGGAAVDMSDFLLHEAQAQLQLALLGAPESLMDSTNEEIRATFMGDPTNKHAKIGSLGHAMKELMKIAQTDNSLALPTDGCPVRGPLSRAVQTSNMDMATNYGNMLLILFAGHDTTGHTMTWLLFELARHPQFQKQVIDEVDDFFKELGDRDLTYRDLSRLPFLDLCITETLRLDRHRNPELWGDDVNEFNPNRKFEATEVASVGCPMAAANPQSLRFSPFAHAPRNCLGRNFAQMEMRLIMLYLFRRFSFSLAPPYDKLMHVKSGPTAAIDAFRGVNRGTMGPMDLEHTTEHSWGTRHQYAMKLRASPRQ